MADGFAQGTDEYYLEGQYRPVRVLTFNVKGGEGGDGRNTGLKRDPLALQPIEEVIVSLAPDIVALQEIAVFSSHVEVADQVATLGERLGMAHAFAPVEDAALLYGDQKAACDFWGNAVLSRYAIDASRVHELGTGRTFDSRCALETSLNLDGANLRFLSTHLSYRWRLTFGQCRELASIVRAVGGPTVVAGDFNATAGSAELSPLHAILDDTFTFSGIPLGHAKRRSFPDGDSSERDLDHIFVSRDVRVQRTYVHVDATRASDHNPVVADLLIPVAPAIIQPVEGVDRVADDFVV